MILNFYSLLLGLQISDREYFVYGILDVDSGYVFRKFTLLQLRQCQDILHVEPNHLGG